MFTTTVPIYKHGKVILLLISLDTGLKLFKLTTRWVWSLECIILMNCFNRSHSIAAVLPILFISHTAIAETTTELEKVVVTASRVAQTVDETLAAVTVITREEIDKSQVNSVVDLLRKYSPGVDFSVSGGQGKASSLYIRGTSSSHVLVLIDGIRSSSVSNGQMAWSSLPLGLIENIEIVRGSRSSLYGSQAIGGIVSITTRKGKAGSWHGSISAGSDNTKKITAGGSFGNKKTLFSINASRFSTDGFDALTSSSSDDDDDGYSNKALNIGMKHQFNNKIGLSFNALHAEGTNEYDDGSNDFVQRNLALKLNHNITENWLSSIMVGEYRDETEIFSSFPNTYNTKRQQVDWKHDLSIGENTSLILGADIQRDELDSTVDYSKKKKDNLGFYTELMGATAQYNYQVSLRTDDDSSFGKHTTGNLSIGRDLGLNSRLTASYGTAFKAPTFNELYWPSSIFYSGNALLKPEKSKTLEIGFRTNIRNGLLSANIFRTDITNLIGSVYNPTIAQTQPQNINKARIDGMELDFTKNLQQLKVNTNLTLLNPRDKETGDLLANRAKQTLKLNLDRDFGKVSLGGSIIAQSKRAQSAFSSELAGYATTDLRAGYKVNKHIQLKAQVNNVFDKEYYTRSGFNGLYNTPDRNVMLTLSYQ